jgi:transposase-like protein
MSAKPPRVFSREFKEAAVRRILAGEKVNALAVELELWPKLLYAWKESFERGGVEALLPPGRPPNSIARAPGPPRSKRSRRRGKPSTSAPEGGAAEAAAVAQAQARIAELERKVGQQALELDFFARALRHVKASRPPSDGSGAAASSPSSRR